MVNLAHSSLAGSGVALLRRRCPSYDPSGVAGPQCAVGYLRAGLRLDAVGRYSGAMVLLTARPVRVRPSRAGWTMPSVPVWSVTLVAVGVPGDGVAPAVVVAERVAVMSRSSAATATATAPLGRFGPSVVSLTLLP